MKHNAYKLFQGLYVDRDRLTEMLRAFYTLTNLKVSFYDTEFHQLQEWPLPQCEFCQLIRQEKLKECLESDSNGFICCKEKRDVYVYRCHAGLMEMIIPLKMENMIIGYIMFGQMIIEENAVTTKQSLLERHHALVENNELRRVVDLVNVISENSLKAATLIGKACISYLLNERVVSVDKNNIISRIDSYINENMEQEFTVDDLCDYLGIKRSSFYTLAQDSLGCSIGAYIRNKRFEEAKRLLKETNTPISFIAEKVGFNDYSYFLRCFKKEVGVNCSTYRKNVNNCQHEKTVKTQIGEVQVKVPRDRNGEYEPKIIGKYNRNADGKEEKNKFDINA